MYILAPNKTTVFHHTHPHLYDWDGRYLEVYDRRQQPVALDHCLQGEVGFIQPACQLQGYQHLLTLLEATDL